MDFERYDFPDHLAGAAQVGDIESNGLLEKKLEFKGGELIEHPPADRIWMACHIDPKTKECWDFIDDDILEGYGRAIRRHNRLHSRSKVTVLPLSLLPAFWDHCGDQYYHNGIKFDFPLVRKLMGYYLDREKQKDTLVMSQTLNCDREYVVGSTSGPHSVESWACRLNKGGKVEHEDWMNFSIDMYKRCWRDVEIQLDIKHALEMEIRSDEVEFGICWKQAMETEHRSAYWISYSEMWGFPCDKEFAQDLVVKLDHNLAETEDELLPNMPFRQDTTSGCGIGTLLNWEDYSSIMLKNTELTRLPLGWCWPDKEDGGRNRQSAVWDPFNNDGSFKAIVLNYFHGKAAVPAKPEEPERIFRATVKAVKEKKDKDGNVIREAVEGIPGIRARKAQPAKEAQPYRPGCYEDEAGLTDPPLVYFDENDVNGPFTRIKWVNYSLGSNSQVVEYLLRFTEWEHTETTDTGNPKLTEDSFESIGGDGLGLKLKNYLIDKSRRTNILNFKNPTKGWLNLLRDDGRITPVNHTMGTPTARSRHQGLVNVPGGDARWGEEMRQCWTAYDNGYMLGIDSSGLEMRMLANEMGDDETTKEIVEGDIHTVIWDLVPDFSSSRGNTKGIEYCLIYGGSDMKLGSLADVENCREYFASVEKLALRGWEQDEDLWRHRRWSPHKESLTFKQAQDTVCGGIIRDRIMKGLKPLGDCIDRITKQAEKGFLIGLDGRKLIVRSTHSALNLKLQSTGAILMKASMVECMERLEKRGFVTTGSDYKENSFVELFTFYHDELQFGIPKDLVTDKKVVKIDISSFDLSDKKQKKQAKARISSACNRFRNRQRGSVDNFWSDTVIDLEQGTGTMLLSEVGKICVEVFEEMGHRYNIDCPVTGEFGIGYNWNDTH